VFVSLTTTKGSPDEPLEIATMAGEEMLPWLRQIDGFQGLLMLSDESAGTTLVLSFWESREVAERHRVAREAFRDRITSAVNVEVLDVSGYEVTFADVGPWSPGGSGGAD
jgi:heme-degrading monooxygenase HmoA